MRSLLCLTLVFLPASTFAQDEHGSGEIAQDQKPEKDQKLHPLVGKRVMVTEAGAEIRTQESTVWKSYPGEVLTVAIVNGEWLWIHERGGWLWKKHMLVLDEALEKTTIEILESPTAENFHLRGLAHLALEQPQKAVKDFSEAIRRDSRKSGLYVNRGNAYRMTGDRNRALSDYSTALQYDPRNFLAYNNRGLVHLDRKNFDAAISDFNLAVRMNPQYADAYNNQGVAWKEKGNYQQAVDSYTHAIQLYGRYIAAYRNRGFVLRKLQQYDRALADYSQAARLDPNGVDELNDLAWMLATCPDERFRNGEQAVEDAKRACELSSNEDWNSLDTLGAAYAEIGQFDKAAQAARQALKLAPTEKKNAVSARLAQYGRGQAYRES